MHLQRFSAAERRFLLAMPGIGDLVVSRLEQAGFASLHSLRAAGADHATERVLAFLGGSAWRNRRRAISRALLAAAEAAPTLASDGPARESRP